MLHITSCEDRMEGKGSGGVHVSNQGDGVAVERKVSGDEVFALRLFLLEPVLESEFDNGSHRFRACQIANESEVDLP